MSPAKHSDPNVTRLTGEIPIVTDQALKSTLTSLEMQETLQTEELQARTRALSRTLELELRYWSEPALPRQPYPGNSPYDHPRVFGGREREIMSWRRLLHLPVPILGLHGAESVGKTSLLRAGLIPALRAAGHPIAYLRFPAKGSIAARLLGELLVQRPPGQRERGMPEDPRSAAARRFNDPGAFVDLLCAARRLAGKNVVLVVDQLEEVLRDDSDDGPDAPRAALKRLIDTSLHELGKRRPFHWLLCFRTSHREQVRQWLGEHAAPRTMHFSELKPLGTAPTGGQSLKEAVGAFQAAIEAPLTTGLDGRRPFKYRFAPEGAERLAQAFAAARLAHRSAPLTRELQSVLNRLIAASRPAEDGTWMIEVPERPEKFIEEAAAQTSPCPRPNAKNASVNIT